MKKLRKPPIVFFNASVILAALGSPSGGSAKLLRWVKQGEIAGVISEIIVDELTRKSTKVGVTPEIATKKLAPFHPRVLQAPDAGIVKKFEQLVRDAGDAHVLASAGQAKADYLVTLGRKHLLVSAGKMKAFRIVSPKQLIERLST